VNLRRATALLVLILAVCLLSAGSLSAQTVQGVVTGTIFDKSGGVVPGVKITLTNEGTNVTQETASGKTGEYQFSLVPPGTYTLSVTANDFAVMKFHGIVVEASQTVPQNITLEVASGHQTIEVNSQGSIVQTSSSDLDTTVNTRTIEYTPLLTRNVFDLAFLAPQMSPGMDFTPTSGGARESGTEYLLNGADNNDNSNEGAYNITPPLESVAEFTILTNNFSAEYGRSAGAVVSAIQKSGTNQFHGVLYEFHRDRGLSANDFFSNQHDAPKPQFIRNQFGGEVDGPIKKDKAFFQFSYDRLVVHTGSNLVVQVPTAAELAVMTANAGPIGAAFLKKFPLRTSENQSCLFGDAAATGHIGCFNTYDPNQTSQNAYSFKLDYVLRSKDRLTFTANIQRATNTDAFGGNTASATVQPFGATDLENYHQLVLTETHTFSPTLLNEFTLAHNRHHSDAFEGDGSFTDPEIFIDGANYDFFTLQAGPNSSGVVMAFTQDRWQLQDAVIYTHGAHTLKIGGGWQYGILYRNWDVGGPGFYEFANTTGGPIPASARGPNSTITNVNYPDSNFQNDFPYFQELGIDPATGAKANDYRHFIGKDGDLYANDSWKVSPRLTLNLGLRWEHFGAPTEANGKIGQFTNLAFNCGLGYAGCISQARMNAVESMWPSRWKDFAPRVGFAWDIFGNGKTSLRGGYGIFYDRIFDTVWSNGAWNPPFFAQVDHDATSGDLVFYSVPAAIGPAYDPAVGPGRSTLRSMDVSMKDASSQNFYLGIERQIEQNFLFRVSYQGSLGRHLPVLQNLNRYDGLFYDGAGKPPNPQYTGFNYRSNSAASNYNALITEIQKRFSSGLQFQFGYTYSKLMDNDSDIFAGQTLSGSFSSPYYYVSNSRVRDEYASGSFDHTHAFKLNFVYQLPFLRKATGFVGRALGGWQVSGFYQGYSGHPIQVYNSRLRFYGNGVDSKGINENIGGDYNQDGVFNDHPIYVGGGSPYSGGSPADGIFKDNNPIGCGFTGQLSSASATAACNAAFGVVTANRLFVNPPGEGVKFGMGRNGFRGPWYNNTDLAVSKDFTITERYRLRFRADAVNAFNHPNFDGIDSNLNSGTFGRAQFLVGDGGIYGPGFGGSWGNGIARRWQLSLRFSF
jgi:hypothetical protein